MLIKDVTIKRFLSRAKLLDGSISDYGWYINDILEVINYYISIDVIFLSLDVFDEKHNLGSILTLDKQNKETIEIFKDRGYKEIIDHVRKYYINNNSDKKYLFYPYFVISDNISKYYNLEDNGLIIYGKYKYYSIYIAQDSSTNDYTLYLWKKDTNENGLEFNMKNKEELQKFFEDNDILVQWEENNLS